MKNATTAYDRIMASTKDVSLTGTIRKVNNRLLYLCTRCNNGYYTCGQLIKHYKKHYNDKKTLPNNDQAIHFED